MVQFYLDTVRADIEKYEPEMIIVRRGNCWACPPGLDLARFFEARGFVETVIEPDYQLLETPQYDDFVAWVRDPE